MLALIAAGFAAAVAATGLAVATNPAPASAADDRVQVRAPREFDAGESAGSVTIGITKRTKGCVNVRAQLGIRLTGLTAGQVVVQVQNGGQWRGIGVSDAGDGAVTTAQTTPDRQTLCERQSANVRYRVVFAGDARTGTATFTGEALTARGELIGRDTAASKVNGVKPSPTPSKTKKSPTPSPTPTEALDSVGPVDGVLATTSDLAALAGPSQADDGGFGPGTLVMIGGIGLVGVGAALLVFLFVRARSERQEVEVAEAPTAVVPLRPGGVVENAPTVIMPRLEEP
jgi:hypothetical protein